MLPRKLPKREKRDGRWKSPAHRTWVRGHYCVVPGCERQPIECMHIRRASNSGTGLKPSDAYTCAGCRDHHAECHRVGERTFERNHGIDLMALAREFYERSPHRYKLDNPYV